MSFTSVLTWPSKHERAKFLFSGQYTPRLALPQPQIVFESPPHF